MTVRNLEKEIIQLHEGLRRVEEELRLEKQKKEEIVTECQIQVRKFVCLFQFF